MCMKSSDSIHVDYNIQGRLQYLILISLVSISGYLPFVIHYYLLSVYFLLLNDNT